MWRSRSRRDLHRRRRESVRHLNGQRGGALSAAMVYDQVAAVLWGGCRPPQCWRPAGGRAPAARALEAGAPIGHWAEAVELWSSLGGEEQQEERSREGAAILQGLLGLVGATVGERLLLGARPGPVPSVAQSREEALEGAATVPGSVRPVLLGAEDEPAEELGEGGVATLKAARDVATLRGARDVATLKGARAVAT